MRVEALDVRPSAPASIFPSAKRNLVILVADDDSDLRFLVWQALAASPMRCDVHTVSDGEEALAFLRREGAYKSAPCADIAILDVRMPGRDGLEVVREIRCDPRLRAVRTVILTGHGPNGWIEKEWADRADAYLVKPVPSATLIETIRHLSGAPPH